MKRAIHSMLPLALVAAMLLTTLYLTGPGTASGAPQLDHQQGFSASPEQPQSTTQTAPAKESGCTRDADPVPESGCCGEPSSTDGDLEQSPADPHCE